MTLYHLYLMMLWFHSFDSNLLDKYSQNAFRTQCLWGQWPGPDGWPWGPAHGPGGDTDNQGPCVMGEGYYYLRGKRVEMIRSIFRKINGRFQSLHVTWISILVVLKTQVETTTNIKYTFLISLLIGVRYFWVATQCLDPPGRNDGRNKEKKQMKKNILLLFSSLRMVQLNGHKE